MSVGSSGEEVGVLGGGGGGYRCGCFRWWVEVGRFEAVGLMC